MTTTTAEQAIIDHHEEVMEQARKCQSLYARWEEKKDEAAAAKKDYEAAQKRLTSLAAEPADQMRLPLGEPARKELADAVEAKEPEPAEEREQVREPVLQSQDQTSPPVEDDDDELIEGKLEDPISAIESLTDAQKLRLNEAGIMLVRNLRDTCKSPGWYKDVKGIGQRAAEKIELALENFLSEVDAEYEVVPDSEPAEESSTECEVRMDGDTEQSVSFSAGKQSASAPEKESGGQGSAPGTEALSNQDNQDDEEFNIDDL